MARLNAPRRVIGNLLLLQVFRQEDEEFLTTSNTIFIFSLALLFVSVILTAALVAMGTLAVSRETQMTLQRLDNYGLYACFWLTLSTLMTVLIKSGSFERSRARFLLASFSCILVSIVMMAKLLISLVL